MQYYASHSWEQILCKKSCLWAVAYLLMWWLCIIILFGGGAAWALVHLQGWWLWAVSWGTGAVNQKKYSIFQFYTHGSLAFILLAKAERVSLLLVVLHALHQGSPRQAGSPQNWLGESFLVGLVNAISWNLNIIQLCLEPVSCCRHLNQWYLDTHLQAKNALVK